LTLAACLGTVGAVAFFPMKLSHGRTCALDPGECGDATRIYPGECVCAKRTDPQAAVARYVYPYGVLWWGSLLFGFVGVYGIVRRIGGADHRETRGISREQER